MSTTETLLKDYAARTDQSPTPGFTSLATQIGYMVDEQGYKLSEIAPLLLTYRRSQRYDNQ